jgi:two-component system sensor kinase
MEEQKRLAHEMHDDFGQLLAAMKMDISALRQYLPQDDIRVLRHLGSINDLVDAMVTSVRRIVADLPPKILDDAGLFSALKCMAASFEKWHGIAVRLEVEESEPRLELKLATAIYRVIQETLTNVAKHANASLVEAQVACSDKSIALCVRDNGRGMSCASIRKPESFGLIGMRERILALGGKISIESGEGAGTTITVTVPLDTPAS